MSLTNANLIRQLLKSIIGRYRYIRNGSDLALDGSGDVERDCRALEEFLISGLVIQKLSKHNAKIVASNVSPANIFFSRFMKADAEDCILIGMLHDMTPSEIYRRFSMGQEERLRQLIDIYEREPEVYGVEIGSYSEVAFDSPSMAEHRRVIEVWVKGMETGIVCHDPLDGSYTEHKYSRSEAEYIKQTNKVRKERGLAEMVYYVRTRDVWHGYYLSPKGDLLGEAHRIGDRHPFVLKAYPLIDGEIHSMVEDVLGQQIYVNKLIRLHDTVLENSAKGALLFPAEQLPDGFSWRDLRKLWSNPGSIIPYKRTSKGVMPQQVQASGKVSGATDMLELQLRLFDEVAGVSSLLRGNSNERGAEALKREAENTSICMLDILSSFYTFTYQRDSIINRINEEMK
jgi:hypothetical protein